MTTIVFFTFGSPTYTFSVERNRNVYTPSQVTNTEKYQQCYYIKIRVPTLVGSKQLFHPFFPHRTRLFHFSTEIGRT